MKKTKIIQNEESETVEEMPFVPPEIHELAEHYVVKIPVSDIRSEKGWDLRLHIAEIIENRLGDEVQLTSLKVRQPHMISRSVARLKKREPCARAYVTIKF
jgi:hypothetical protein